MQYDLAPSQFPLERRVPAIVETANLATLDWEDLYYEEYGDADVFLHGQ